MIMLNDDNEIRPCTIAEFLELSNLDFSNWRDVRNFPDTVTCRRIISLNDATALSPIRWWCNKMRFLKPEMTQEQIGKYLHISTGTVRRHLQPFALADDIYQFWGN